MPDIRRVGDQTDLLGESPIWCDRENALYWVDARSKLIRRYDYGIATIKSWSTPELPGSIGLREKGGLVVALASALAFFDPDIGTFERVAEPEANNPAMRFNDGKCDRQGRFWAGTMHDLSRGPEGTLYRLGPDRSCAPVFREIRCPNSLCWSPDSRTMYFADSNLHTIGAFDFNPDTGSPGKRREFAKLEPPVSPDGSCVDAEGFVWNAEYDGWKLTRYAPDGRVDRVIKLPLQRPTSCAFGGPDLDILYVTTASQRLSVDELTAQPLAGGLLAMNVGVRGLPEPRYAG
jgi:sugar lactone lactonase YvrE